jgi:hypothetical protein
MNMERDPQFPKLDLRDIDKADLMSRVRLIVRFNRFVEEKVFPYVLAQAIKRLDASAGALEDRVYRRVVGTFNATRILSEVADYMKNVSSERQKLEQTVEATRVLKQGLSEASESAQAGIKGLKAELEEMIEKSQKEREKIEMLSGEGIKMKKRLRNYVILSAVSTLVGACILVYTINFAYENTDGLRKKSNEHEKMIQTALIKLQEETAERKRLENLLCAHEYARTVETARMEEERRNADAAMKKDAAEYAAETASALETKMMKTLVETSAATRNYCSERITACERGLAEQTAEQRERQTAEIDRLKLRLDALAHEQISEIDRLCIGIQQEFSKLTEQSGCFEYELEECGRTGKLAYETLSDTVARQKELSDQRYGELKQKIEAIEKNGRRRFFTK